MKIETNEPARGRKYRGTLRAPVLGAIGGLIAIGLTGCAQPDQVSNATTEPVNIQACEGFVQNVNLVTKWFEAAGSLDEWDDLGPGFDVVALGAEGDVKDRMMSLADKWDLYDPNGIKTFAATAAKTAGGNADPSIYLGVSDLWSDIERVLLACEVELGLH